MSHRVDAGGMASDDFPNLNRHSYDDVDVHPNDSSFLSIGFLLLLRLTDPATWGRPTGLRRHPVRLWCSLYVLALVVK